MRGKLKEMKREKDRTTLIYTTNFGCLRDMNPCGNGKRIRQCKCEENVQN